VKVRGLISGQSRRRSRSKRRRFVKNSDTLELVEGSCVVLLAVELADDVAVNRAVAWSGLLVLAGGRGGLGRTRGALAVSDAMPAPAYSMSEEKKTTRGWGPSLPKKHAGCRF